eukprot:3782904-Heterocapsa_arctica.AAC.1
MDPGEQDLVDALAASPGFNRLVVPVGPRRDLPSFDGQCVGDDVSWKGASALRCVALQTQGCNGSLVEWGKWWGRALQDLGADVGVLSETKVSSPEQHTRARNGLLDLGYVAVSHNVPHRPDPGRGKGRGKRSRGARGASPAPEAPGPRAAGVILAVRIGCATEWIDVKKGPHGRAIAGSIALSSGAILRCVGVYGITGACLPGFQHTPHGLATERD